MSPTASPDGGGGDPSHSDPSHSDPSHGDLGDESGTDLDVLGIACDVAMDSLQRVIGPSLSDFLS